MNQKERIMGDNISIDLGNSWSFNRVLPNQFEEHIAKSVPLYKTCHELIGKLSRYFVTDHSLIYELGSATGILSYQLVNQHEDQHVSVAGIDVSENMVNYAKKEYIHDRLTFQQADITEYDFEPSDLIISFYTVQFIKAKYRDTLVKSIYQSLNKGGAFIFFEKVNAPDSSLQDMITDLYMEYKLENEYTLEEIYNKKKSLVGVLEPYTHEENLDLLKRNHFSKVVPIFQHLCFQGYLAIK